MTSPISRLQSAQDTSPRRLELGWRDFAAIFFDPRTAPCTRETCPGKTCPHKRGACWSPAAYASGVRRSADIEGVSMLVLDVDRATDDRVDAIRGRLGHLRYLIHATHSDRPHERSVRIVVPLARAVPPEAWRPFWVAATRDIELLADLISSDPGRVYFLPSRPRDAGYFVQVNEGQVLDAGFVLAGRNGDVDVAAGERRYHG